MPKNKNATLTEGKFLSLMSASLKGISQVILIENVITGLIILLSLTIYSYYLGLIALISAIIGTLIGKLGGADEDSVNQGLFGYNSVLTGLALTLLLTGANQWIFVLIGAAVAAILTAAMMHFMKNTGIPILTLPFIIVTWFTLLVSYRLEAIQLSASLVPQDLAHWELNTAGKVNWLEGTFTGIGQVFFLDNPYCGALLFIAVFWASWKFGLFAILGNAVALLTSYVLGGEHSLIFMGLYGYNAILTSLAVALVFNQNRKHIATISGISAACLTVPITASVTTWLLPYGLPSLTMPFILSTWIFLGAKKVLPNL
ncbi:urea transporter [Peribacillus huizhouensis]|uniref:Urea transporter n=1 Tax=Peribacillus huizhouensis TaxID=1501239 RepID=A0ABR6CLS9_9BACI|nr:urea transporter [Peribacillus huizhouensis]MBA9025967.1 urea transporter [Peribacillus huizhouensis]